jgi:putative aldouronate transport system permease protein
VADIISTYTYRLSFSGGTPQYSYSTAIGLFNTIVNVVFLLATNFISSRVSENSLF